MPYPKVPLIINRRLAVIKKEISKMLPDVQLSKRSRVILRLVFPNGMIWE